MLSVRAFVVHHDLGCIRHGRSRQLASCTPWCAALKYVYTVQDSQAVGHLWKFAVRKHYVIPSGPMGQAQRCPIFEQSRAESSLRLRFGCMSLTDYALQQTSLLRFSPPQVKYHYPKPRPVLCRICSNSLHQWCPERSLEGENTRAAGKRECGYSLG